VNENVPPQPILAPWASSSGMRRCCACRQGQLLYKIMTVETLLRSIDGGYLHFNCVDSDLP
jgi:hypothetical protein